MDEGQKVIQTRRMEKIFLQRKRKRIMSARSI